MKKQSSRHDYAVQKNTLVESKIVSRLVRLGLVAALGASLALSMPDVPHAQQQDKLESGVKVTNVSTSGNIVSISADGSLARAQTWQDPEGFHIVLPHGQADSSSVRGAKVRRIGNSLEIVVPVRQGANVTVQPRGSRLDLIVNGGTGEASSVDNTTAAEQQQAASAQRERAESKREEARERNASVDESSFAQSGQQQRRRDASVPAQLESVQTAPQTSTQTATQPQLNDAASGGLVNLSPNAQPAGQPSVQQPASAQLKTDESENLLSLPLLLVLLAVAVAGAAAFFLIQRRRGAEVEEEVVVEVVENRRRSKTVVAVGDETAASFQQSKGDRRKSSLAVPFDRRMSGPGALDEASREHLLDTDGAKPERSAESKSASASAQLVEFGPYRIDQEVARLVQGKSHSIEVVASRSMDDKRAIETSLLKALRSTESDEDGRRRARTALEDYGFVARSCAALLLGAESFERASAARTLGEMKSAQALPFLTEALYDADPIVRMECVQGLGALGMPSAIGALLDIARRHPDLSNALLGPALTSCSVESLELSVDATGESRTFADAGTGEGDFFTGEFRALGKPSQFDELPEWVEDETLRGALERISSEDVETRVVSAQKLAQYQVRRAVESLAAMSQHDPEPAVRSAAVTSLGVIDHESVFVQVIIALADESREVRAAAARALSRLSFERADAYVRVIESADAQMLGVVAQACVKAGLAAQAISRLASEDRRQALEAFSLMSLVAKAGEVEPILETIECNRDIEVRLICIRLLELDAQPELRERLQRIGENGGVPEKVRRTIKETLERASKFENTEQARNIENVEHQQLVMAD